MRLVLALLLLAVPAASVATGAHAKRPAAAAAASRVRGVVAWTGRVPDFADPGCDLQPEDFGGRTDLSGGLAHVVIVVEPGGGGAVGKPSKHGHAAHEHAHKHGSAAATATSAATGDVIDWDFARAPFMFTAHPNVAISVRSPVALRFLVNDKPIATVAPDPSGDGRVVLPAGVVKILDDRGSTGWVYVTPYLARTSNGNCRFSFLVAPGHYRLRAWHPQAGERTLDVDVAAHESTPPLHQLVFTRREN